MRNFKMLSLEQCTLSLLGLPTPGLRAPWPVWRNSTTSQVKWQPMPKRVATRLWHRARDFDRQTRRHGKHGGAIGHSAMQVLHTLIFDFLNYSSGRLDPSWEAIAKKANVGRATVGRALARLYSLGILRWLRRCAGHVEGESFLMRQETNAYAILPCSQWQGYTPPPEAPPPASGTWGDHQCGARDAFSEVAAEQDVGAGGEAILRALESDPDNELARVLASLGRTIAASGKP